jgi:hypothetical protein
MTKYVCFLILGDKYVNGEIIPCKYPTFQPKRSGGGSKSEGRRYERRRDGPISAGRQKPRQETAASDSSSTWGSQFHSLFHSGCYWSSLSCSVKQYLYEVSNIHGLFPVKGELGFFPIRNQSFLGDRSSFAGAYQFINSYQTPHWHFFFLLLFQPSGDFQFCGE